MRELVDPDLLEFLLPFLKILPRLLIFDFLGEVALYCSLGSIWYEFSLLYEGSEGLADLENDKCILLFK